MAHKAEAFWTKVFGLKVGDKIRLKYGKVTWTVHAIFPQHNLVKLIRYRPFRGLGSKTPYSFTIEVDLRSEMRKVDR